MSFTCEHILFIINKLNKIMYNRPISLLLLSLSLLYITRNHVFFYFSCFLNCDRDSYIIIRRGGETVAEVEKVFKILSKDAMSECLKCNIFMIFNTNKHAHILNKINITNCLKEKIINYFSKCSVQKNKLNINFLFG